MFTPTKTYTDNPFVDNVIYYAKLLALNSVVKDEEEALNNETPASLNAGDVYISCIEGTSVYELFESIPKEILEKYIASYSNLDMYVDNPSTLQVYLNSLSKRNGIKLLNRLSELARVIYIDHYNVMMSYIESLDPNWIKNNKELYDSCKNGNATYRELFDITPKETIKRVFRWYLNNYDGTDLDTISNSLEEFDNYISNRTDVTINQELDNISRAMRNIFVSHYDMMIERGYVRESKDNWTKYIDFSDVYERCLNGTSSYHELYDLFPKDSLLDSLNTCIGDVTVSKYNLTKSLDTLEIYFNNYSANAKAEKDALTENMTAKYLSNYGVYINFDIYNKCVDGLLDYFDLVNYIPKETLKIILNTEIEETTNLDTYESSKSLLNNYLNTLPLEERNEIKEKINLDMRDWYPKHHVETNNYYRAFIGLPPMDSSGYEYEDTLYHTYDEKTKSFIEFGNRFINMIPETIYPAIHWKQRICDFDAYDIGILREYGILDDYIAACGSTMSSERYRYIKYLADEKLDLYTCRRAMNFQLIGIPTIDDEEAKRKFLHWYAINRDYVIRTVYSDAYKFQSDYYNKFIIIFIMVNTIMDMLSGIPELIVNREVFDSRCIKYLFESFGIPYYSEIPVKYQRAMLKNLNILIKYKSSTRNMIDICNLFGFSDVRVFGYYLFKQRNIDGNTGEYLFDENNDISYNLNDLWVRDINGETLDFSGVRYTKLLEYRNYDEDKYTKLIKVEKDGVITEKRIVDNTADVYIRDAKHDDFIPLKDTDYFTKIKANTEAATLKFIKVPIDEQLTEYKNDPDYINNYDEIVYQDEGDTWDGGLDHEQLKQDILDYEFNAVKTKYISVETVTEMTELAFQVAYFYNMLFDNMYSEEGLTVEIPFIKIGHKFKFMDIVCYLFALMYFYNDLEDNIMYSPTQILYVKGYNFNEDFNTVLKDATAFQQNDPTTGLPLEDYEKYNIFDVNERIAEDGYNYQEAFKDYDIRAFNLSADVDALEKWLNDNYQMSLDDFIVDDTLTTFNQIITLRSFFSLNNSYYQKDIFKNAVTALPYNQVIKTAYDYDLYEKIIDLDIDGNTHEFVLETIGNDSYYMEVIDNKSENIYIYENDIYAALPYENHAIFRLFARAKDGSYKCIDPAYYTCINGIYEHLFNGEIGIVNNDGKYIFAADVYYTKNEDGSYTEVTDERFFSDDPNNYLYEIDLENLKINNENATTNNNKNIEVSVEDKVKIANKKVLNFGEYYILKDGIYVLDPTNCYIKITKNGETQYILFTDADKYTNPVVAEEDCYVLHSDGHFIKLTETDYYIRTHAPGSEEEFVYNEEDCYIITDEITEYYDPTANPIVYYKKLSDYYTENNWVVYRDTFYVKNANGEYISEDNLLDPNNCYYTDGVNYFLVAKNLGKYLEYTNKRDRRYVLALQESNDYNRLKSAGRDYVVASDSVRQYVLNSNHEFVTVLYNNALYENTSTMIVVFNKEVTTSSGKDLMVEGYDPEVTDGIWDENDWFYKDPSFDDDTIGMNGENKWYYRKPGEGREEIDDSASDIIGSGFFMESTAYIGDITLDKGEKYYMAFDIETNFTGRVQIYNEADSECNDLLTRVYEVINGEKQHITQVFTANDIKTPSIKFLIYDFTEFPIECGDYITVSNIRFIKSHSDNFIAQDIPSYDRIQELYRTNEAIYKYLVSLMANCSDKKTYDIYKKLYDSLMISKYNKEAFKIGENEYAKTYTEFLKNRDAVLYEQLNYFKSLDIDAMHKQVADQIIEVTYAIDDCVDTYSYGYLYSYFPAVSANYIQQYISKIINFFKSWKTHLLGINTVYKFDDPLENTVRVLENQEYRIRNDFTKGNVFIYGTAKINPLDDVNISGIPYTKIFPDLVKFSHIYSDKVAIKDRVRVIAREANIVKVSDNTDDLHIILNNDDIKVTGEDGTLIISSGDAGFRTLDKNQLIMTTDETDEQAFVSQILGEINLHSTDITDWEE